MKKILVTGANGQLGNEMRLLATCPSVNGLFRRMAGQVFAQFFQVHPLVGRPYLRDIVQTVNLGVKFIQLVHHP